MRLLLSIHNDVTCYFMLARIAVDGRYSPPSSANVKLGQATTIVISLSLLLAPVAVNAGFEDCKKLPRGIKRTGSEFELTPSKKGVNALFSVGYEPLVVFARNAHENAQGAVIMRVSRSSDSTFSDDDCYSIVQATGYFQFFASRWCPPVEGAKFKARLNADQLVVTFNDGSVVYTAPGGRHVGPAEDEWDGFKPYAQDEREGWDLWNLTFTYPSNNPLPPLTIYM
ncbi:hypothetical protein AAVH_40136, partial [Aphelenchoides avenae]